jgi:hypothetical protein
MALSRASVVGAVAPPTIPPGPATGTGTIGWTSVALGPITLRFAGSGISSSLRGGLVPATCGCRSMSLRGEHPHLEGIQAERQLSVTSVIDRLISKRVTKSAAGPTRRYLHIEFF